MNWFRFSFLLELGLSSFWAWEVMNNEWSSASERRDYLLTVGLEAVQFILYGPGMPVQIFMRTHPGCCWGCWTDQLYFLCLIPKKQVHQVKSRIIRSNPRLFFFNSMLTVVECQWLITLCHSGTLFPLFGHRGRRAADTDEDLNPDFSAGTWTTPTHQLSSSVWFRSPPVHFI